MIKKMMISLFLTTSLSACISTAENSPYTPTASLGDIESAKANLSKYESVTVEDGGFIVVSHRVRSGYKWDKISMRQYAFDTSCDWLNWYVDRGFVVNVQAQGRGGSNEYYNAERCAEGSPTNL
ncbi:hypothetical protein A1OW_02160 [Enterovibrio norvegicus]|uniref:Lipoprotein n=1 Tax=Enterovibrio norvegicus TaxID=188144 RepID=A0ABV4L161_9GAMM|nr:hypothetical protein [Enterovibrio norvegicus]OEE65585.1 hypothetical protein A1OS_13440 [Enterovibrio norvegicus]OEF49165.1 hypothetical protein A1OW_02160 [Enterovibrio norvegicus]OEF59899.1 hypothetical protein A1OU_03700 [Enterovibrio norvegicus]